MFFKKPKRYKAKTNPNAVLVNWIVLGFVAIGLSKNYLTTGTVAPESNREELKKTIAEITPDIPMDIEHYKEMLFPSYQPIQVRDITPGEGQPLVCGQKASIAYSAFAGNRQPVNDKATRDKPLSFRVGEHKVMPALELGAVGMLKGGKRIIAASAKDAYRADGFIREDVAADARLTFDVELLDAQPPLPDAEANPFRIADLKPGIGKVLLCGNTAKVSFTVKNMEGKTLYSTPTGKPLEFQMGKSEVFLGLEQGVIGMRIGSQRSLVVPPGFQKTMNGKPGATVIAFPPKQTVLVDVEALP